MSFDYGNILTRAFQITWRHKSFWLFSIIPMLFSFAGIFFFIAPVFLLGDESDLVWVALVVWLTGLALTFVASFLIGTVGSSALMLGILRVERGEGSTSFMDLLRDGLLYFRQVLGVMLIVQLSIGLVMTLFFCFYMAASVVTMGLASICFQPIFILMTPLSFLMVAVIDAALMAVISEDMGPWDAVKRGIQVVRDHVWKFVILTLIVYFGTSILMGILITPATIPVMAFPLLMESGMDISWEMFLLIAGLFSCIFFPLMALLSGVTGTFMNSTLGISYLRLARPAESEVVFASDTEGAG